MALSYINKRACITTRRTLLLGHPRLCLLQNREYQKALTVFTYLVKEKEFGYSYYGRGLVYEAVGDRENAVADLREFLAQYTEEVATEDAKSHLESLGATP
ncbi:MAG: hypothetical protein IPO22_14795 [Anaerolineales bacterium]|nr:hypothetical protein [Anaerolineales bacterium]